MKLSIDRIARTWNLGRLAAFAGVSAALFILPVQAAERQVLHGHVPAVVARLQPVGRLAADKHLNLAIGLPLRNQAALTNLLHDLYDPASPSYHHYLTPKEFAERFGPTEADYQTLSDFAQTNGLKVTFRHSNRVVLDVEGSVSAIEKALHVTMRVYQHPTESRTFYAPDAEPGLDVAVSVLHISGLDNYSLPRPKIRKRDPQSQKANLAPRAGSGPDGNYMGYDFRAAYVPGTTLTGVGQAVGLLEFDAYYPNDVAQYLAQAGLPSVPLQDILVGGFDGTPGDGNGEVTLDIDMAIAMAPGLSAIYVYEAANPSPWVDLLNRMATDDLAKQLSCSWGGGPPDPTSEDIFLEMAAQGQSFFDAIGDSDAFPIGEPIAFPGESPNITQVGGTTLTTSGPGGAWVSETVWNWGGGVGGSGGISTTYSIPVWQQGINMQTNQGSATMRNMPDVALTADNIFIIADDGMSEPGTGGTSAAAPLWAAFTALVNQQAAAKGQPPVGFLNPALYAIGKGGSYAVAFHDITTGNNTWSGSPNLFYAVPGYDLCTGWGTPAGTDLINLIIAQSSRGGLRVLAATVSGGNGNGQIDPDECDTLQVVLINNSDTVATGVNVSLSTLVPGIFLPQPTSSYPDVPAGATVTNLVPFKLSTSPSFVCGTPVNLIATIKSSTDLIINEIPLPSGISGSASFTSYLSVAIPDNSPAGASSPLLVTNLLGPIQKVTVSLYASHQRDSDLTLQLIGPDGTTVTLSANHGGQGQDYGLSCFPVSFSTTFDDDATNSIASGTAPFVGTFKPDQPLSAFIGKSSTNALGTWQLRLIDGALGMTGTLWCWTLNVDSASCTDGGGICPGVDLSIGMTEAPNPATIGSNLVYSITVTNNGPGPAHSVTVAHVLPGTLTFVSAAASQGSCYQSGGTVTCVLGTLAAGATATVTVAGIPNLAGVIYSTANVASTDPELNPLDNTVTIATRVIPPVADLAVGLIAAPNPGLVGQPLTYTVTVVNNGPATASGVVVTNTLPSAMLVNSASASQGTVTVSGNVVLCNLGLLGMGGTASATINTTPQAAGSLVATALVGGRQGDPYLGNNLATVTTTIGPAADLALGMVVQPNSVVVTSNLTYFISVTNNGPSVATSVVVSHLLPASVTFVSAMMSQGAYSQNGNDLLFNLGALAVGGNASIIVVAATTAIGTVSSSATVSASQADPVPGNNSANVTAQVNTPTVIFAAAGATLTSESFSPPNGAIDIGEQVTVQFRLQNVGNVPNTNLVATLLATGGVTPVTVSADYGVLHPVGAPGGVPVSQPFTFVASGTAGGTLTATLRLQDAGGLSTNVSFGFVFPVQTAFTNSALITIPQLGAATPYPSVIAVSGVTNQVSKVTASLAGFSHTFPHDVNVLLVSPAGVNTLLLSHAAWQQSDLVNANITFDDDAPSPLPAVGDITDGSWQISVYAPFLATNAFPSPAPGGPWSSLLSDFNGLNPNGNWSLYVLDDSAGDAGQIANGWSLAVTGVTPVNQVADLGVSVNVSTNAALVGDTLIYTFSISNAGPAQATGVTFSNTLPANLLLLAAVPSQGNCTTNGGVVIGNLATLAPAASATVTITASPTAAGTLSSTGSVSADETDLHTGNNSVTALTTVTLPQADVSLGLSAAPNPVTVGSNLTYSVAVTNNGPGKALNVVVSSLLPGTVAYVSGSVAPSGTISNVSGTVTAALGNLAAGAVGTVSFNVIPASAGLLTSTATVSTASIDTVPANNSAAAVVSVINPAPVIVLAKVAMVSESFSPADGTVDPGETVSVSFALANTGTVDTTNLVATLQASGGVTAPSGPLSYGHLVHGGAAVARTFTFTGSPSASGIILATFQLQDGAASLGTVSYAFVLPGTTSYANANAITIPDHGVAGLYPSTISVAGVTGVVSKTVVALHDLTHTFPSDINVLLVSPAGGEVLLMSHAGGGYGLTDVTLVFADSADNVLPDGSRINTGLYRPSAYGTTPAFPNPAPKAPYASALATLNSANANGTWLLYVLDDKIGDSGAIAGGWSLDLTAVTPVSGLISAQLTPVIANGFFQLSVAGTPGRAYIVETSTDFTSWTPVSTNTAAADGTFVTDPVAPGPNAQFFRTVLVVP